MKSLFDQLSTYEPEDILWIAEPVGNITIHRLAQAMANLDLSKWKGKSIAIGSLPVLEFIYALIVLDGLARRIVLLPTEENQSNREIRLKQAEIDIVVEGNGFGFTDFLRQAPPSSETDALQKIALNRPPAISTTWLLPTSGTTGTPKLITHTIASLTRSMTTRRMGSDYTWGSLYSLRRFAGLQVFLQSCACGTPLILNEESADINNILARFIDLQCNALSATPSMWRKLAMHTLFPRLPLKQITLGGEIVDQAVLTMLSKQFPHARITHIYASTEAGVGFAVRDGRAGFPAEYLKRAPLGISIRIDEQNHLWFGNNEDGEWIDSGDVVELKEDRVYFRGRANGSINVGGNKVMPEEIEMVISELPGVAFVLVRPRKSAMLGSLVEAAITPIPGVVIDAAFKKQVIAHCRARLDSFKVPAFIVAEETIKLTATGKLSRTDMK
ncbi:class I adenylate-forming enzyme family protein [Chromobacterium violaceum]|uniref:class I adenylate-forming enzyme family protein n=1 Tax=Chromobacterium violaceum TaxID=536 RepID=UPI0009BA676C|nr:class I adenylate-forming enzyme family protein [Chromobacterium violaceum]